MPLSARRVLKTFKYAMYFDGVDDRIRAPQPPSLTGSASFTVMFWLKFYIQPLRSWILYYGDSVGAYVGVHFLLRTNYLTQFGFFNGVQNLFYVTPYGGVFAFYATRYDNSTALIESFINGNKVDSDKVTATPVVKQIYVYIGCPYAPGESYLKGYMAQILIYSRALSDSEILWNYNYPNNPIRNGLVLWLQADPAYVKDIDNDGILEWIDLSGYNNHGKIYGAQLVQLIKSPSRVLQAQRVLACAR